MNTTNPNDSNNTFSKHPVKNFVIGFFVILIFLIGHSLFAQVGVGTTNPQAALDIAASNTGSPSSNDGLLIPRVTNMPPAPGAARDGMMVFYLGAAYDGKGYYYWDNPTTSWIKIASGGKNTLDEAYDEGGAGSGKNITADNGALRINGTDGFLVTGIFNSGDIIDTEITGAGTRLFFNPRKAAFRAGTATGNVWDNTSIGNYSVAMGYSPTASNSFTVALGRDATASGASSVALGWDSSASGDGSLAFGYLSDASGSYATAIGRNVSASGTNAFALGENNDASGTNSTVFGLESNASGLNSVAIGSYTNATGNLSMAFGALNTASGYLSTVFGRDNIAPSGYETVIGLYSTTYTPNSTTGYNSNDRLFVVGNGPTPVSRSNALTIYKNGLMNINDEYNMPLTDGTNGEVMTTDGAGNVSFQAITAQNNSASNGLNEVGVDIRLGGALTQNTTITNGTNNLIINANSTGTFRLQDGGTNKFEMNAFGDAVFGGDVYFRDENSNATSTILARLIDSGSDGIFDIYQGGTIANRIRGNGVSYFNGGKVAIGQTTADGFLEILAANSGTQPHIKLVHNGDSGARINFTNTSTASNVWTLYGYTNDTAANSVFNFFHTGTGNIMQITGDGKVAVGAAVTEGTFNVTGDTYHSDDIYLRDGAVNSGDVLARLYDSSDDGVLDLYEDGSVNHRIHSNGVTFFNLQNLDLDFRIESQARTYAFMVDASENLVRIGDYTGNTPQQGTTKSVNGNTFNVDYVASITDGGIGSSVGYGTAEFITDGGNNITMMDSNFIPFNDDDDALGRSDYRWTALWAIDGTINTSDLTLKRNVQPLNYGLDALMNVQTITYQWKNSQFNDTKIGFSAQNLQNIIPEVVRDYDIVVTDELTNAKKKVPSKKLGVYYSDIIPVTVKAIQELNNKIEALETENASLKAKLNKLELLEARILALENNNTINSTKNETASVTKE